MSFQMATSVPLSPDICDSKHQAKMMLVLAVDSVLPFAASCRGRVHVLAGYPRAPGRHFLPWLEGSLGPVFAVL